jgi:ketosteroid isomerase-like protein
MSQENVEIVLRGLDAMNRRDAEAAIAIVDPEFEWIPELFGTPTYRGYEGIRQAIRDIEVAWASFRTEAIETRDCGDRIFVTVRATGQGRTSGAPVTATVFYVATFRDGTPSRLEGFTDKAEALKAAGLSE